MELKKLLVCILLIIPALSFAGYPEPIDEYVNDFARVIDNDIQRQIRKKLYNTEYYSGVEIVVITIRNFKEYKTGDKNWEEFSTGLFNKWGIGNKKDNDGVMLLVSVIDRKVRIELGAGYGFQYNSIMKSIIKNTLTPNFKNGEFTKGVEEGVGEIINQVTIPVSFFEWYNKYIFAGIGALISLVIALKIDKKDNIGLFWIFLALAGILILEIIRGIGSGRASEGHGGGSSDGGGASGDF